MNAIHAMANIGDGMAVAPLIAFFGSTDDSGLKAAAGNAIAALCRANGVEMDDESFKTLLAGTADEDLGVRIAAYDALGAAQLTDEQIAEAAMQNRPKPSGGGEGS
jgi:HEAT repeat protein